MSRCEGLAGQVCYPVTEIIVTRHDEAALFTVKGVTYFEPRLTPIAMRWEVWGIQPIPQEEDVTPLLGPQLCPIDCGQQHCEPGPGLCRSLHSTGLQDRGPLQCRRQLRFSPLLSPVPHGQPYPPKTGRVIDRL